MASSFTRFLDRTQRRATVGSNPLTIDQPVAETSTRQHTQQTNIHAPVGFERTFAAGEWPQTCALDGAATWDRHCAIIEV
jgi:hypothetical protein